MMDDARSLTSKRTQKYKTRSIIKVKKEEAKIESNSKAGILAEKLSNPY